MEDVKDTLEERGKKYGEFKDHAFIATKLKACISLNPQQQWKAYHLEALHMILHKVARIINGDADYDDSWRDIAGYAMLVVQIINEGKPEEAKAFAEELALQEARKCDSQDKFELQDNSYGDVSRLSQLIDFYESVGNAEQVDKCKKQLEDLLGYPIISQEKSTEVDLLKQEIKLYEKVNQKEKAAKLQAQLEELTSRPSGIPTNG